MLAGCTEGFPRVQAPHSRIQGPAALIFYTGIEHPRIWVVEPTPHGSRRTTVILNYGTLLEEEFQGEGGESFEASSWPTLPCLGSYISSLTLPAPHSKCLLV